MQIIQIIQTIQIKNISALKGLDPELWELIIICRGLTDVLWRLELIAWLMVGCASRVVRRAHLSEGIAKYFFTTLGIVYLDDGVIQWVNPFSTALPLWGDISQILSSLFPKRDCGTKRVKRTSYVLFFQRPCLSEGCADLLKRGPSEATRRATLWEIKTLTPLPSSPLVQEKNYNVFPHRCNVSLLP